MRKKAKAANQRVMINGNGRLTVSAPASAALEARFVQKSRLKAAQFEMQDAIRFHPVHTSSDCPRTPQPRQLPQDYEVRSHS